ncbi:MAG: LppX_LprAFG lipoprotein [Thermoleophilia bacterium]|nr:LppX_LprAFG lipoprotein [Thermoleophilia bacterium]
MDTRTHRTPFLCMTFIAVLLAMMALTCLAGCGEGGGDVDPREVLAASSAKMKVIKGFHFEYEVHLPEGVKPGGGLFIKRIIGDVNAEGEMKATVDANYGSLPVSLGFVALGDMHYIQDPVNQKWQTIAAADSPVGSLSLSAGTIRILERITDTSYDGTQTKGGVDTYHITGKVAAEEVEAIAGAVNTTNTFPTDLWIGVDSSLVYEVKIAGAATPNEHEDIWRSIVLSNLDTYVDIEAPQ